VLFYSPTRKAESCSEGNCLHAGDLSTYVAITSVADGSFVQVLAVTKHHKKSPYALIFPYMRQVAPFLIFRMCTKPSLLMESCRLMSISPTDFISVTLPRTLPQLFAGCELKVLEAIAKDLATKPSSLFLKHSHEVLAHVFLLQGPGQTNKALTFILKVLTDAAENATIDIQNVVKSCVVPLLAELVIVMGDENAETAEMVSSLLFSCLV
jgi:serine/threonine-protein kinase ATR